MSKFKNAFLGLLFLSSIMIFSGCSTTYENVSNDTTSNILSKSKNVTLEGVITNVHNGCWADGICSIEVDNKWNIAIISGGLRPPNSEPEIIGEVVGVEFNEGNPSVGKKVKIFAKKIDESTLSIFGSDEYFVKVIE